MTHPPDFRALLDEVADMAEKHVSPFTGRGGLAAEIEAVRDVMLPEEPEPRAKDFPVFSLWTAAISVWRDRQRLRTWLTEQARIAREGS